MSRSASYHKKLIEDLKNSLEAASYIEVVLEEGDPRMLRKALKNVIEAQGGVHKLSEQAHKCYEKLDRTLLEKEEIEFYCFYTLLDALGLHLAVTVKSI